VLLRSSERSRISTAHAGGEAFTHQRLYEREWTTAAREFGRAVGAGRRAVEIDPHDSHAVGMLSLFLLSAGRTREAIPLLEIAIERDPRYFFLHRCLGLMCLAESRYREGIAALEEATLLSRGDVVVLMDLAVAHAHSGHTQQAEEILAELEVRARRACASPTCMSAIQLALGREREAMLLVERAIGEGDPVLVVVRHWSYWRTLQGDPHHEALLRRIGWT